MSDFSEINKRVGLNKSVFFIYGGFGGQISEITNGYTPLHWAAGQHLNICELITKKFKTKSRFPPVQCKTLN